MFAFKFKEEEKANEFKHLLEVAREKCGGEKALEYNPESKTEKKAEDNVEDGEAKKVDEKE